MVLLGSCALVRYPQGPPSESCYDAPTGLRFSYVLPHAPGRVLFYRVAAELAGRDENGEDAVAAA